MADLVRLGSIEALQAPQDRDALVRARVAIHASITLQKLFEQSDSEQWETERLASALSTGFASLELEVEPGVCRYLAEEHRSRNKELTLLVSAHTGLPVAQVPEDAIYVPEPVAREGTDALATPLPRLRPEIETAIVLRTNERAADPVLLTQLAARTHSTVLQRTEGDLRFRIATRSGRKRLAERLREELPELLRDHHGSIGRLFARCRLTGPIPEEHAIRFPVTLRGHAALLVADALAMNYRHDSYRSAREKIRAGWGRALAKAVATIAHQTSPRAVTLEDPLLPEGLLIGSPDLASMARQLNVVAVPGVSETVLSGNLFLIVNEDDDAYRLDTYETESRWCLDASVTVTLYLDTRSVHPLLFTDLVESGLVVEVLS
jgi:hypothetical protein